MQVVRSTLDNLYFSPSKKLLLSECNSGVQPLYNSICRHNEIGGIRHPSGTGLITAMEIYLPFHPAPYSRTATASHYFSYVNLGEKHSLLALRFDPRFVRSPAISGLIHGIPDVFQSRFSAVFLRPGCGGNNQPPFERDISEQ